MPATTLTKISGDNQYGGICNELTLPLKVQVTDGTNGVSGSTVTFEISSYPTNSSYHILSATSVTSDSNGYAESYLKLGSLRGKYIVTVASAGLTGSPLTFTAYATSIISLAELKEYRHVVAENATEKDEAYCGIIGKITEICEETLEQYICPREITEILNGSGRFRMRVNKAKIISVSSVQDRIDFDDAWEDTLDDIDEELVVNPENHFFGDTLIELIGNNSFTDGIKTVKISYLGGFNPIPSEIRKMALEMCEIMIKESKLGDNTLGMQSKSESAGGVKTTTTVYKELRDGRWKETINKFKKRNF